MSRLVAYVALAEMGVRAGRPRSRPGPSFAGSEISVPAARGLARDRLEGLIDRIWECGFALVRGPAGSGKTTLMAQFASRVEAPVAWCPLDASDAEEGVLVSTLETALVRAVPALLGGSDDIDDLLSALDQTLREPCLLVVDDLHSIDGSPAEKIISRLVGSAPSELAIIAASRTVPGINVPRLRVNERVIEIGPDLLRFRSWEVERLFKEVYREPMPPEDLAELARRTDGWAAGLQLFHLATAGRPTSERRYVLGSLAGRSKLVREYLATNVLDTLPTDVRSFLLASSVLGKLSGPVCDELLGRRDSTRILDELERRQLFMSSTVEDGWFRYHEVLRSYLVAALVEQEGEDEVRMRFCRAAAILERSGAPREAVHAYCRGGNLRAVGRLLGRRGNELAEGTDDLLENLPTSIVAQDPWLVLARARQSRAAGRWHAAIESYRVAEESFASEAAAERARGERQTIASFLDATSASGVGWAGAIRAATGRDPLGARRRASEIDGPVGWLASGICALLAGHLDDARADLLHVETHSDASAIASIGARVGLAIVESLSGEQVAAFSLEAAAETAERCGVPWLSRIARAALGSTGRADWSSEAAAARLTFERFSDAWGGALAAFFEGWGSLRHDTPRPECFEVAAIAFHALGAGVLETWANSLRALAEARASAPSAAMRAARALTLARRVHVPGAELLALHAVAASGSTRAVTVHDEITALAASCGLEVPTPDAGDERKMRVEIDCLGGLRILADGEPLDLSTMKPRVRAALRFFLTNEGRPVHREVLLSALWPELDAERGARSLHVALSGLRRVFGSIMPAGSPELLVREGAAYALMLPAGVVIDTNEIERAVIEGAEARAGGDVDRSLAAYRRALALYEGELFPEDGPTEWVLVERERLRGLALGAAIALADLLAARQEFDASADTCAWGLRVDRYRDELWRLRISALQQADRQAAALHAAAEYRNVLRELGIEPDNESLDVTPAR